MQERTSLPQGWAVILPDQGGDVSFTSQIMLGVKVVFPAMLWRERRQHLQLLCQPGAAWIWGSSRCSRKELEPIPCQSKFSQTHWLHQERRNDGRVPRRSPRYGNVMVQRGLQRASYVSISFPWFCTQPWPAKEAIDRNGWNFPTLP